MKFDDEEGLPGTNGSCCLMVRVMLPGVVDVGGGGFEGVIAVSLHTMTSRAAISIATNVISGSVERLGSRYSVGS